MANEETTNKIMTKEEREQLVSSVKQKGVIDDSERQKIVQKLDADFDAFLEDQLKNSKQTDAKHIPATDEDVDRLADELMNHPAFMKELDMNAPLSKETEALIAMQYDDNAESYKEDGNRNFKIKKYRWAIDNYTEGIKCRSKDKEINAVLYCNRAAAQFHLGNYGSSLRDASIARKFKPDHMKAIIRGVQCCLELKRYSDAIRWCDDGLLLNPNEQKLMETRQKADKLKRQMERDRRRENAKERKETQQDRALLQVIQSRGVTLAGINASTSENSELDPSLLVSLESHHPSRAKVFINDKGQLEWPVLFLYPEHGESDFIARFDEHANFEMHLEHMFGIHSERVPWDTEGKYKPDVLEIYFENKEAQKLYRVKPSMTLASVLKNKKYVVYGGTPGFIILVKDSQFAKSFLERYQ